MSVLTSPTRNLGEERVASQHHSCLATLFSIKRGRSFQHSSIQNTNCCY